MTTALRQGTPPNATTLNAGTPSRSSWWTPLPLVAAVLAALGLALASPHVEDRIGPVVATGAVRALILAVVVACMAHEIGRASAARRSEQLWSPTTSDGADFDLVAVASHEIRTPLTSMLGLMSTVQRGAGRLPPDRLSELAGTACEQGWLLERLIDDLLAGSPGGTDLRPERRDAVATVRGAVAVLAPTDHELVLALPDEPVLRCLDHDVVVRMVTNLVGNALKYTPGGTRITVATRPLPGGLELSVTDDGPGMTSEDRTRAFDKYWRGDTGRKGMGLGLHLVRLLAAAHGGTVTLEEAPAGGCRFVVRLGEIDAAVPAPALAR